MVSFEGDKYYVQFQTANGQWHGTDFSNIANLQGNEYRSGHWAIHQAEEWAEENGTRHRVVDADENVVWDSHPQQDRPTLHQAIRPFEGGDYASHPGN